MASLTVVCDLKPFKSMWKIRVKIIRLWKQYSAAGGLTIEMVLIDSNVIIFTLCFLFLANITSDQIFLKLNIFFVCGGVKISASIKKDLVN